MRAVVGRIGLRVRAGQAAARRRSPKFRQAPVGHQRRGRHALRRPLEPVRLELQIAQQIAPASDAADARRPRRESRARTRASTRRRRLAAAASSTSTERPPRASVAAQTSPL